METFTQYIAPLWLSPLTGLIAGFVVSMPIGPINITIINDGMRHGFLRAWFVGLGAATMDILYCGIGLAGFSTLFDSPLLRAALELGSFMLLSFLGLKYLSARSVPITSKASDAFEHRFHPHTGYMVGLVRVLGNPGVLILWITLTAIFVANAWVGESLVSKLACTLGVGVGASLWFLLLSFGVSRGHGRFSDRTLLNLSHLSGACLLIGALLIAGKIVGLIMKHHLGPAS